MGKLPVDMTWRLRPVEIILMALPTLGIRQIIISVDVAALTRFGNMRAFESEFCLGMVEG